MQSHREFDLGRSAAEYAAKHSWLPQEAGGLDAHAQGFSDMATAAFQVARMHRDPVPPRLAHEPKKTPEEIIDQIITGMTAKNRLPQEIGAQIAAYWGLEEMADAARQTVILLQH